MNSLVRLGVNAEKMIHKNDLFNAFYKLKYEATLRLYRIALAIPNTHEDEMENEEWDSVEPMEGGQQMAMDGGEPGGEGGQPQMGDTAAGDDYESPDDNAIGPTCPLRN